MKYNAVSVTDLNKYIKDKFESDELLTDILVKGEISNFKSHYTGHLYFTLKDENSLIKCIMFKSYAERLKFNAKDGMKVMVFGTVSVFERDGVYQIYVKAMQEDGLGDLYTKYEELKKNLEEENEHRAKHEIEDKAIEAVCENAKVEIPSGMIENEIDAMSDDLDRRLAYQGVNLDQYLKILNKSKEAFRDEMKPQAEVSVKTRLVLEAITKDAKILVTEEELNEKIEELAKTYGREADELKKNEEFKKYVSSSIETEKAIKFVVDNAKIK